MLRVHILSKYNIKFLNRVLLQWRNITVRLCSSSSDSSSDSDSDTEKAKSKNKYVINSKADNLESFLNNMIKQSSSTKMTKDTGMMKDTLLENSKKTTKTANATNNLTEYINNMIKTRKLEKTIDVAIQPKKRSMNSSNKTKHVSYEQKLINAAENIASTLGGDKTKTTSDLLEKVLASRTEILKKEQFANTQNIKKKEQDATLVKDEEQINNQYTEKKSIIHTLLKEYNIQSEKKTVKNTVASQLVRNIESTEQTKLQSNKLRKSYASIDLWNGESSHIFENMGVTSQNVPELKTWTALNQRELKALTTYPPANIFQELILWTEQGKLWKFPIDNEQGMEEEHNVHFTEHVFMERNLKDWCPKSGPIRHFMELVCIGLSKNPYLTVQEKINHIMWYKDFFESKQDLLQELGAIQEPFPGKVKEIQE